MSSRASEVEVEVEVEEEGLEWLHFFIPMTIHINSHQSETMEYGSEVEVTAEMREASVDRAGHSWLDLLSRPDEQVRLYGELAFAAGRWPVNLSTAKPGSREWLRDRDKMRTAIQRTSNRHDRAKMQAEYRITYGSYLQTPQGVGHDE